MCAKKYVCRTRAKAMKELMRDSIREIGTAGRASGEGEGLGPRRLYPVTGTPGSRMRNPNEKGSRPPGRSLFDPRKIRRVLFLGGPQIEGLERL